METTKSLTFLSFSFLCLLVLLTGYISSCTPKIEVQQPIKDKEPTPTMNSDQETEFEEINPPVIADEDFAWICTEDYVQMHEIQKECMLISKKQLEKRADIDKRERFYYDKWGQVYLDLKDTRWKIKESDQPEVVFPTPSDTSDFIDSEVILEQVYLFTGGGGGALQPQKVLEQSNDLTLTVPYRECVELMSPVQMYTKTWLPDKEVLVTITFPNGEIQRYLGFSNSSGVLKFEFFTSVEDPPGRYYVEFKSEQSVIQGSLYIEKRGPRMKVSYSHGAFLHGFSPNERVHIITHEKFIGGEVLDEEEYEVDSNGQLLTDHYIREKDKEGGLLYIALGEVSGEATGFGMSMARHSILSGEVYIRVLNTLYSPVEVREHPRFDSPVIYQALPGEKMRVLDESEPSKCPGKWMKVRLPNGNEGWLMSTVVTIHNNLLSD